MSADSQNTGATAASLYERALVWDMTLPWGDIGRAEIKTQTLPRFKSCGVNVVSLTLARDDQTIYEAIRSVAKERAYVLAHPDQFVLVETVQDIHRAKEEGKLAVSFHFQGTNPVQGELDMVEVYYRLGIRHMLMAYNKKNFVGDGCHEPGDGGLSRFGRELVKEMYRVGMLVDCSHTGYRTSMDVFEVAEGPVIFSHSNPRALYDHERNIRDEQIRACAESGGVIGINGIGVFMGDNDASTEKLLRQIDYCTQMVGAGHIGIGLDFVYDKDIFLAAIQNRRDKYPSGQGYERLDMQIAEPEQLPEIAEGLLKMGYSEQDIMGILGGNWLDIATRVWK